MGATVRWFFTLGAIVVAFMSGHAFAHHLWHPATTFAVVALCAGIYACLPEGEETNAQS